jgi:hypothetical protein
MFRLLLWVLLDVGEKIQRDWRSKRRFVDWNVAG